jgi:hypothetical protein
MKMSKDYGTTLTPSPTPPGTLQRFVDHKLLKTVRLSFHTDFGYTKDNIYKNNSLCI